MSLPAIALAPPVADDSTLPRFAVPAEVRTWGNDHCVAERRAGRATAMLLATAIWYVAGVAVGEVLDTWWGWALAWIVLVAAMMRLDAAHHEAVHRSLYRARWPNDLIASVSGALTGFHAPAYRCFHLTHHAATRRSSDPRDPEDFYDEMLTSPMRLGPVTLPARLVYVVGTVVGGLTFAVQLVLATFATFAGRPPEYVRTGRLERHVRRWGWLPFALWAGPATAALLTGHGGELLRWWIVPMLLFLAGPYTFFALPEHDGAPADQPMVRSTGSVRTNGLYRWIALDGNFHLAHHVFPSASWWWLESADAQLVDHARPELRHTGYLTFHRGVWRRIGRTPD